MKNNRSSIDKLTALWALNESGLGGLLHVLNSPFTGLLVGGIAVLLISLIAWYSENKWKAILKALLVVLIIKAVVSPHSPPTAYLAVSFQAVLGAFLFSVFSWKGFTLVLLGMLTFLESALQKLIVLTLIYGEGLWEAIDNYGLWLTEKTGFITNMAASSLLISGYLIVYGVGGVLAGLFTKSIITLISKQESDTTFSIPFDKTTSKQRKNRMAFRHSILLVWGITIAVILFAFTFFGGPSSGWQKAFYIMLRSLLVLLLWYVIIGPFLLKLIRRYLRRKESEYKTEINNAMELFPYFRSIIAYTWRGSKHLKGYARFKHFVAYTILYCIHFEIDAK